jgi:succinate dehydrogenase / fumarate reductase cytochrome b subunit
MQRTDRPVFLNLARIRFPVGAVASIGHRISGVVLVCLLPFAVLALQRSLAGESEFTALAAALRSPLGRAFLVVVAWACAQHLFAGIRHLLSDVGIGASLHASRKSAFAVLMAGAAVALAALLAGLFA